MFQLTWEETENFRSQFVTLKPGMMRPLEAKKQPIGFVTLDGKRKS